MTHTISLGTRQLELNDMELYAVARYIEHQNDISDVKCVLEEMEGVPEAAFDNAEFLENLAKDYREWKDCCCRGWEIEHEYIYDHITEALKDEYDWEEQE